MTITSQDVDTQLALWEDARSADPIVTNDDPLLADYATEVIAFFNVLSNKPWMQNDYDPDKTFQQLNDGGFAAQASLDELCAGLTYITRRERIDSGTWEYCMNVGMVAGLMDRLRELRTPAGSGHDITVEGYPRMALGYAPQSWSRHHMSASGFLADVIISIH